MYYTYLMYCIYCMKYELYDNVFIDVLYALYAVYLIYYTDTHTDILKYKYTLGRIYSSHIERDPPPPFMQSCGHDVAQRMLRQLRPEL